MYEATKLPEGWINQMRRFDEIWAPSAWGRRLLVSSGVPARKVRVVPEGLDTAMSFNPKAFNRTRAREVVYPAKFANHFVFLSVFKWEERKGVSSLVRAFASEFVPEDNVVLCLRTTPPHAPDVDLRSILKKDKVPDNIIMLEHQHDARYQMMLAGADAFVLPTHGEGWGRPIVEAMAMALPVIATNWSAPPEYLSSATGYVLPVKKLEDVRDLPGAPAGAQVRLFSFYFF